MDDILVAECNNRNTVYVLNSSYRYGNLDMIELFGSPAGRALTLNNKTAAELQHGARPMPGSRSESQPGGNITSTNISSIICPDGSSTAGHHFIESSEFIRFASSREPTAAAIAFRSKSADASSKSGVPVQLDQPSRRNNLKMAKFWKLFDEDRLRKANGAERTGDKLRQSRWIAPPVADRATESVDKSANDLYSEAAQLLGIKCALTDSCRCIDCQSQYFDCDDDADTYSEYSDKSYDLEDNLFTHRSYYNDHSTVPSVPDTDTFGAAGVAAINDRLNRHRLPPGRSWDTEGDAQDVNGNECQHYLHSTHNPSSLNLSLDEGQPPASDRSQLPIDTSETEARHPECPEEPDEIGAAGASVA